MPIIYAIAGFLGGYLVAMTRQNLQERSRRVNAIQRMRAQGWTDVKTTLIAGLALLGLLYLIVHHH